MQPRCAVCDGDNDAELVQVAAMCARWAEDVCGALPPTDERGR